MDLVVRFRFQVQVQSRTVIQDFPRYFHHSHDLSQKIKILVSSIGRPNLLQREGHSCRRSGSTCLRKTAGRILISYRLITCVRYRDMDKCKIFVPEYLPFYGYLYISISIVASSSNITSLEYYFLGSFVSAKRSSSSPVGGVVRLPLDKITQGQYA